MVKNSGRGQNKQRVWSVKIKASQVSHKKTALQETKIKVKFKCFVFVHIEKSSERIPWKLINPRGPKWDYLYTKKWSLEVRSSKKVKILTQSLFLNERSSVNHLDYRPYQHWIHLIYFSQRCNSGSLVIDSFICPHPLNDFLAQAVTDFLSTIQHFFPSPLSSSQNIPISCVKPIGVAEGGELLCKLKIIHHRSN